MSAGTAFVDWRGLWAVYASGPDTEPGRYGQGRAKEQDVRPAATEWAWIGYAAEGCVHDLLIGAGIPCRINGGVDDLPDVEVGEKQIGADVKTQTVQTGSFQPAYTVSFAAAYLRKQVPPLLIFCAFEVADEQLVILGAKRSEDFFTEARMVLAGQKLPSGATAPTDQFILPAERLVQAKTFVDLFTQPKE